MGFKRAAVLIGMATVNERDELARRIRKYDECEDHRGDYCEVALASHWMELESRAAALDPQAIVLGEDILPPSVSIENATRRLAAFAPLVVVASAARESEILGLLVNGQVDLVHRSGEFISVAAALIERRLRSLQRAELGFRAAWAADLPSDFAEILRHEINNPLTGILGNAELLLSQLRDKVSPVSVQRLETVVDLTVRLRETIRCLSSEWEQLHAGVHSS